MAKLGDMPIPVIFTRDQIRVLRGMISSDLSTPIGELNDRVAILELLDDAETIGTINHASMTVKKRIATIPHWRCGVIHPGIRCPT